MEISNETITALVNALSGLLDWGREHTSPRDSNSPHELLIAAAEALDRVTADQANV